VITGSDDEATWFTVLSALLRERLKRSKY